MRSAFATQLSDTALNWLTSNAVITSEQRADAVAILQRISEYGITLSRVWTEWAAEHSVSETIAAALYLVSRNRKADEVVVKLTPSEMERVIAFVQCWPDHYPPGALIALKNSRPTSLLEQSAACGSPDEALTRGNVRPARAYGPAGLRAEVPQRATEHATVMMTAVSAHRVFPSVILTALAMMNLSGAAAEESGSASAGPSCPAPTIS